jgi:hypothetical protein
VIEIDEDGWRMIDSPPVYFRRSSGMKPLPEPVAGGSLEDDLKPLLNVKSDDEFVLNVAWLLAALRPAGPYPVLGLAGEQGSAKSMRTNFLRALVDPNSVPLRALPRSEHDLFIAARNSHVLAYDNASGLPDWLSDAFCRLATGGGFSTRQLYTDDDEVLFGSKRPILLNGIDDVATRPDLADRSIVQNPAAISDERRKPETDLWKEFEQRRPRVLGALLTAISHGLRTLPHVRIDRKPRMADFAVWVSACEGALWKNGTFMAAYTANITEAIETVLEADQVATVLRSYMDATSKFEGTASEMLKSLNCIVPETQQKAKGWPKRPANLAKTLRRIAAPLRKVGIDITFEREGKQGARNITVTHQPVKDGKAPSPPSASSATNDLNNLRLTVGEASPSALPSASPATDKADSAADSRSVHTVSHDPLNGNAADSTDGKDGILFTSTASPRPSSPEPNPAPRLCDHCGLPEDHQPLRQVGDASRRAWLHRRCEVPWLYPATRANGGAP